MRGPVESGVSSGPGPYQGKSEGKSAAAWWRRSTTRAGARKRHVQTASQLSCGSGALSALFLRPVGG